MIPLSQQGSSPGSIKVKRSAEKNDFFEKKFYNSQSRRLGIGYSKKNEADLPEYQIEFEWYEIGDQVKWSYSPDSWNNAIGCGSSIPKGRILGWKKSDRVYWISSGTFYAEVDVSTFFFCHLFLSFCKN